MDFNDVDIINALLIFIYLNNFPHFFSRFFVVCSAGIYDIYMLRFFFVTACDTQAQNNINNETATRLA